MTNDYEMRQYAMSECEIALTTELLVQIIRQQRPSATPCEVLTLLEMMLCPCMEAIP